MTTDENKTILGLVDKVRALRRELEIDTIDRSYSMHDLARALNAKPCHIELSYIIYELSLAQLSELVEHRDDPSFVLDRSISDEAQASIDANEPIESYLLRTCEG